MTATANGSVDVPAGLRGVVVTTTELGDVRGDEGFYHYRQYPATELARTRTFEDVWFLFLEGRLPTGAERSAFAERVAALRVLPPELRPVLDAVARSGERFDPMSGLRAALSVLGTARGLAPTYDATPRRRAEDATLVCALTPTILAALYRLHRGQEPVPPHADLPVAANWLYQVTGQEPDPAHARAVEQYLVATVDHGFNASTFTARVVASCGADVVAAVAAAIGAFTGPLHGGAPDRALAALDEIGSIDRVDGWVRERILAGDRIMGFGHAVYRTEDPRAVLLREVARGLGGDLPELATAVERRVVELLAELKPGRQLYANVEFYAGVVMELCGLPREMFTPTFAVARVVGWCANILEQAAEAKLIRPAARYVGPPPDQPPG